MYLTFGKYRNHTIKETVEKDKQYSQWLMTQPWFTIKHKDLYNILKNELSETIPKTINEDSFIAYTDGACKNNGSQKAKAGIGVYFYKHNSISIPNISERLIYKT